MRSLSLPLVIGGLALAACGNDDGDVGASAGAKAVGKKQSGATITLRDSAFGPMLFDSKRQAIYVFERDSRRRTVCYGKCARDWPPVFTSGAPRARKGVKASLLGTIRRRGGRKQVTYAGRPLYFYAHEDPGQVLCHNVDLNGGFWWAVGADGKRRPV